MHKKKYTILIVEDEEALRDLLDEELSARGFRIVVARNGIEGIQKIQDTEPDAIICDRAMPGMTGHELLERIRGIYPQYRSLPFIFLTAMVDPHDKERVKNLGAAAYLEKPLDFEALFKTLESVLYNR